MTSSADADGSVPSDVLVRARSGDAAAAELLDAAFRAPLTRFCLGYLGHPDAAEDAVQDVLARALESSTVPDTLRTWLYRVARNHCLNVRRGLGRRRDDAPLPTASRLARTQTGFLTRLVDREQLDAVERAFGGLSDGEQEALRLRYAEELSRAEIASVVDAPESVVKSRLFEGLKKLRARLGDA